MDGQKYIPKGHSEDFRDKLGIHGMSTFYDVCRRFPNDYDYDDHFGIEILTTTF
jgi:hypothetical protein